MERRRRVRMGGALRDGYCIVGGVVKVEVKEFFDKLVSEGIFESRSKVIGHVLTEYTKRHKTEGKRGDNGA